MAAFVVGIMIYVLVDLIFSAKALPQDKEVVTPNIKDSTDGGDYIKKKGIRPTSFSS